MVKRGNGKESTNITIWKREIGDFTGKMDGLEERGGGGKTPCTPFLDNNVYNVIYTLVSGLESERRACLMSCFFF